MPVNQTQACRICHRTPPDARFRRKHRCITCDALEKRERDNRIKTRGPRVVSAPRSDPGDNPAHLGWIRSLPCAVNSCVSRQARHAHHVRAGSGGGTGMKPSDRWVVPLCPDHHAEGHQTGWVTFEAKHRVDLRWLAQELSAISPHLSAGTEIPNEE